MDTVPSERRRIKSKATLFGTKSPPSKNTLFMVLIYHSLLTEYLCNNVRLLGMDAKFVVQYLSASDVNFETNSLRR